MIKLKQLLKKKRLSEMWMPGPMSTNANKSPLSYASEDNDDMLSYATESSLKQHKDEWFMSKGINDWTHKKALCSVTINEENQKPVKIWAEIKTKWLKKPNDTHRSHHERVNKTISKISNAWTSEAKRLYNEPKSISENGTKTMRTWKECFIKALESSKVSPFISNTGTEESQNVDPVNFTPRV